MQDGDSLLSSALGLDDRVDPGEYVVSAVFSEDSNFAKLVVNNGEGIIKTDFGFVIEPKQ